MKKFLFQGDSITDYGRDREGKYLGFGYVTMASGLLSFAHPGKFEFLNRGVSGNRSIDMYARLAADTVNLTPDYMSVLIGVNDALHKYLSGTGITPEKYREIFKCYISEAKAALPDLKIIIMEPFCLDGEITHGFYKDFSADVSLIAEYAKGIAEQTGCVFVPLKEAISAAAKRHSNEYILHDGIHPAVHGNAIIAHALFDAFEQTFGKSL